MQTSKLTAEEKLNLLVDFGLKVSNEIKLDALLDVVATQITKILNAARCIIFLKDSETKELWSQIAQGKGVDKTEIRIPLGGKSIAAAAANTGEVVNITNAYEDPRFTMEVDMVTDFRTRDIVAVPLKNNAGKVLGVFQVSNKNDGTPFDKKDEGILLLLAAMAAGAIEIARLYQDVHVSQLETIYRLAVTAEYRDQQDTRSHLKNISIISYLLALALGLSQKEAELIKNASPLHDIGKVALADSILLKPAKLTDDEYETMKMHTTYGGRILEGAHSKVLQAAHKISLCHHEKWDGSGYPGGLKGKQIPMEARIVSVADVFDALCMDRVYKTAWSPDEAFDYIAEESGKAFDPDVVEAFRVIFPTVRKIYKVRRPATSTMAHHTLYNSPLKKNK